MADRNPFKAVLDIRREELPFALMMYFYFFLTIASFWILKPLKKSIFIEYYHDTGLQLLGLHLSGPQAEQIAKVLNMLVALVAAVVFSKLSGKLRRQQLTFVFSGFFLGGYAFYSVLLENAGPATIWTFYLYGDLYTTLMVATFFAFLNDSVSADGAKRIYGLVGLGGVTGGVFGTSVLRTWISVMTPSEWMWVCALGSVLIVVLAWRVGLIVDRERAANPPPAPAPKEKEEEGEANQSLFDGLRLIRNSPYLLSIVTLVGVYEIISSVMDFQFTSTVNHYLDGPAIAAHFATVFLITNIVALTVQLFFTSFVMKNLGVGVALLVLPCTVLLGSSSFVLLPLLWTGSLLNTADSGFSYSINQSAKEALYVPLTPAEKYKAKAFIDMFVQRFGKAIAVVMSLGITLAFSDFSTVRWLTLITIPLGVIWVLAARYAGRRFSEMTQPDSEEQGASPV